VISISRAQARLFAAVLRQALVGTPRRDHPSVAFQCQAGRCRIRATSGDVMVEFTQPGSFEDQTIVVPAQALKDFGGRKNELVTLTQTSPRTVQAQWTEGSVPQTREYALPLGEPPAPLPEAPAQLAAMPSGFATAWHSATQTAGLVDNRFALQKVQLRGSSREIVATDGKQLLIQRGFDFPWADDVLVSRLGVFGCQELREESAITIGRTDQHVVLRVGAWTFFLRLDAEARYPKVDQLLAKLNGATTHLRIAPEDAAFLARLLPTLPGEDDGDQAVTVDLNGQVCLRAHAPGEGRAIEVILRHSNFQGKAVRFVLDRPLLIRVLQLGFAELHIVDADKPLLARDDQRTLICMPIPKEYALAPGDAALRIVSGADEQKPLTTLTHSPRRRKPSMESSTNHEHDSANRIAGENGPVSTHLGSTGTSAPNGTTRNSAARKRRPKSTGIAALIEETEALKHSLREITRQAHNLVVALKRHRKQNRLVQTSLQALKELQSVE
jgi:hypothetical protein